MKPGRNQQQYEAVVAMRQSSKAGPQDSRPNRQRTRRDAKQTAIREQS